MNVDANFIKTIADQIVSEAIFSNWKFYALILAITAVGSASASLITEFFKTKGKNLATKADFDEILAQVKQTTEATERIKSEVSQDHWHQRENVVYLKQKLEELLSAVFDLHSWLNKERDYHLLDRERNNELSPIHRINMLATLYFPELKEQTNMLVATSAKNQNWIVENVPVMAKIKKSGDFDDAQFKEHLAKYQIIYKELMDSTHSLEDKAKEIMDALISKR